MRKRFLKSTAILMMTAGLIFGTPAGTTDIFGTEYSSTVYAAEAETEETEAPPVEDPSHYDDYNVRSFGSTDLAPGAEDMAAIVYSRSGDKSITKPTQSQILAKYQTAANVNVTSTFSSTPSVVSPYAVGRLNTTFVNSALTFLNFYRYCSGLGQVTLDSNLSYGTDGAQYGAVVLAANNLLTHTPSRPSDMSTDFYDNGYGATTTSNISKRTGYDKNNSFRQSIYGCMNEKNSTSNITTMGHRRWFLNPSLGKVGFGYAESTAGSSFIVSKVFDRSATPGDYDFVSWPASGNFPNDILDTTTPWSITLNPSKFNTSASVLNSVKVKITRASDGRSWTLSSANDKSSPVESDMKNSYFHVDRGGYAIGNCIIFQIGSSNLGHSSYSGEYRVEVTGLKTLGGSDAKLDYKVNFFSMGADISKINTPAPISITGLSVYNGVDYSKVYDYVYYLINNTDVYRAFGGDPQKTLQHFINNGMKEGRQAKATFDVFSYKNKYSDLRSQFGKNLKLYYEHYMKYGANEGRIATGVPTVQNPITKLNGVDYSRVYDFNYYISKYPDMKRLFGNDDIGALEHFINYGMKEGRQGKASFELASYKNAYRDLRVAFGDNNKAYYMHYINSGYKEKRVTQGVTTVKNPITVYNGVDYSRVYDYNYYLNNNSDIKRIYGNNDIGALKHFVTYGMKEGRQGSAEFSLVKYKARYADLRRNFGNDNVKYYMHYITNGYKEHRSAR